MTEDRSPVELVERDLQIAEHLWNEVEYRHELFWRSLFRWGLSVVVLNAAPYLASSEAIETLGDARAALPFMGAILSLAGFWHIASEYDRLKRSSESLDLHRERAGINPVYREFGPMTKRSVGRLAALLFLCVLAPLSVFNTITLGALNRTFLVAAILLLIGVTVAVTIEVRWTARVGDR